MSIDARELRIGNWIQYGIKQSGEPLYWNVYTIDKVGNRVFAQRFNEEGKLEHRAIATQQYTLVTDEKLCKELTKEFVG